MSRRADRETGHPTTLKISVVKCMEFHAPSHEWLQPGLSDSGRSYQTVNVGKMGLHKVTNSPGLLRPSLSSVMSVVIVISSKSTGFSIENSCSGNIGGYETTRSVTRSMSLLLVSSHGLLFLVVRSTLLAQVGIVQVPKLPVPRQYNPR